MPENLFDGDSSLYDFPSHAAGPAGQLPLTEAMLRDKPSGDLFGWTQNAGMGWSPKRLADSDYLILSTHGGARASDGTPIARATIRAIGKSDSWSRKPPRTIAAHGRIPFAAACTDPCDGRSQGTSGMFDSLPYRNDAAVVFRRLVQSLATRKGVLGIATCDKGLPAMMMALAALRDLPCVLVPGGVTLPPLDGEDAGRVQTIGARFAHGEITLEQASELGCRACGSAGGGCQSLGTAATSQVVGEALGLSLGHTALAPSGQPIWLDMARRSAAAFMKLEPTTGEILDDASIHNAMVTHAAFGGSTNLLLHIPAVAHAAGLRRPDRADGTRINKLIPRLVDALPNGPRNHPTIQVFLAGGVPEAMLHLRRAGLLETRARTVSGLSLGDQLDAWQASERRHALRARLRDRDGVDPDRVIFSPDSARAAGLTSTVCFPVGNLAPQGSVVKSTAIDPSMVDSDGVYRKTGSAKVFFTEPDAIAAVKNKTVAVWRHPCARLPRTHGRGDGRNFAIDVRAAVSPVRQKRRAADRCALQRIFGRSVRRSRSPEALAGGPIGKLRDGDCIEIVIDRNQLEGSRESCG